MDTNHALSLMNASEMVGMIKVELLMVTASSYQMGKKLLVVRAHGDLAVTLEHCHISESYAQLLMNIAERVEAMRGEGRAEHQAIEALSKDRELMGQLIVHVAQAAEAVL